MLLWPIHSKILGTFHGTFHGLHHTGECLKVFQPAVLLALMVRETIFLQPINGSLQGYKPYTKFNFQVFSEPILDQDDLTSIAPMFPNSGKLLGVLRDTI